MHAAVKAGDAAGFADACVAVEAGGIVQAVAETEEDVHWCWERG